MRGITHTAAGISVGILLSNCLNADIGNTVVMVSCSMIGSIFPDIDNASSKIGHHVKPASYLIQLFIGHRTVFHAPVLYLILGIMITATYPRTMPYVTSFLIGAASHILLDSFNPAGVPLLWPINKHFHIANFKSGGIMDRCLGLTLWIIVFLLLWKKASSVFSL